MIVLPRQARDKHSLGKALKRKRRFLADPALLCNQGAAAWYGNCLFRHCIDYSNLEHLPRQARDKHEGNGTQTKERFFCRHRGSPRRCSAWLHNVCLLRRAQRCGDVVSHRYPLQRIGAERKRVLFWRHLNFNTANQNDRYTKTGSGQT